MTEDLKARAFALWTEVAIFVGAFMIASLVGALIWQGSVDLPRWQSVSGNAVMGPIQATKTIGIDAVYLFVSVPIALLLGAGLTFWRRRTPVATIILLAFASLGAAALMERFGLILGPSNPASVLRTAAVGSTAPVQLQVQATGVLLAWPAAAVLGALLVLLFAPEARFDNVEQADKPSESTLAPN